MQKSEEIRSIEIILRNVSQNEDAKNSLPLPVLEELVRTYIIGIWRLNA